MQLRLDEHLCAKLYIASRLIVQGYAEELKHLNLTYPKYLVLLALDEKNSQTVGELGEVLCLDSGTLSPLLQSLSKLGYIERKRSLKDERIVTNLITAKGKNACNDARKVAVNLFELTGLSEAALVLARNTMDDFVERCKTILIKKTAELKAWPIRRSHVPVQSERRSHT